MGNSFKNTWWIYLLVAAGGVILFLSLRPNIPQGDQGVVLKDIFHQQAIGTEPGNSSSIPPQKVAPVPPMVI